MFNNEGMVTLSDGCVSNSYYAKTKLLYYFFPGLEKVLITEDAAYYISTEDNNLIATEG